MFHTLDNKNISCSSCPGPKKTPSLGFKVKRRPRIYNFSCDGAQMSLRRSRQTDSVAYESIVQVAQVGSKTEEVPIIMMKGTAQLQRIILTLTWLGNTCSLKHEPFPSSTDPSHSIVSANTISKQGIAHLIAFQGSGNKLSWMKLPFFFTDHMLNFLHLLIFCAQYPVMVKKILNPILSQTIRRVWQDIQYRHLFCGLILEYFWNCWPDSNEIHVSISLAQVRLSTPLKF